MGLNMPNELAQKVVNLYIPSLCLEIEWKKEDQENMINFMYNQDNNTFEIEQTVDNKSKTKTIKVSYYIYIILFLKVFDEVEVMIYCIDTIPIEMKCNLVID